MMDDFRKRDAITVDSENPSHHHFGPRRRGIDNGGVDLISCLPDEILQHILCFIETKFAIRTSLLSRRWRHICWDTPSLYFAFEPSRSTNELIINKTLSFYTVGKIISFHLCTSMVDNAAHIDNWIEFSMSRKVEKLTLDFQFTGFPKYNFPDFFYSSSSLKQLSLDLGYYNMIPRCAVSWTSLKNLRLCFCKLPDESAAQILSGCPVLESLTLFSCNKLEFLDPSKSLLLRRLYINTRDWEKRPMVIIAPHIHYLRLRYCKEPPTLVDVSSLTEADLSFLYLSRRSRTTLVDFQNMLAKLHNVKKLTLDASFLQILSLAELNGVPFPTFKVEALTFEINIFRSVLTGITKMLQHSPELKKMTVHTKKIITWSRRLFEHFDSEGLNEYQLWRVKDGIFQTPLDTVPPLIDMEAESKFVVWLVKSLLGNTKTVKTIVVFLENQVSERGFSELVQIVPTLQKNKVSIVLKRNDDDEPF